MTPAEKMAENGKRMLRQLDENPLLKLLLQPNPPTEAPRAKCCADYCAMSAGVLQREAEIKDDYRIALTTQDCQHFHVYCLEKILDLASLAPRRFKLDSATYPWNAGRSWSWGLMLRKWFECSGSIDLHKIAAHINDHREYSNWQIAHQKMCNCGQGKERGRPCVYPPPPAVPVAPILTKYRTSPSETCPLTMVLRHQMVDELASTEI